jgi:ubiquinone/menaquinone biosynthesis C-methylase UbiE
MGLWSDRVLPHVVDKTLSTGDVMKLRGEAVAGLRGRVLEIGFGSGLNVGIYPDEVTEIAAVEPSDVGWEMSERRRSRSSVPVVRSGLDGQSLVEPDDSFDSALSTFTLCTIPDALRALEEVRRVLRPGGTFHFLEHGLSPDAGVARWQRRLEPVQRRVAGGCHLTRHVPALLERSGFEVVEVREDYLPAPAFMKPFAYGYVGRAV